MPKGVYDHSARPSKREEILQAATRVYGYYGFEGATLERMAAEAGVSRSLIIQHFGSKQGLVKAVASRAVEDNLARIRRIDETPGLTLRRREGMIHEMLGPAREEWCLILGTLLVPNFQFQMRGEIAGYLQESHRAVLRHLPELRTPTAETAFSFAYSSICLHMGYILGGREEDYRIARDTHQDLYLLPEEEILANRSQF